MILITQCSFYALKDEISKRTNVDLFVIDEGHRAKNINTKIRTELKNFLVKHQKIVLTGTPV